MTQGAAQEAFPSQSFPFLLLAFIAAADEEWRC
jgi:hypothetical protein